MFFLPTLKHFGPKEHLKHKQQLNMPTMSNMMWAPGRLEGCLQGSREGETGLFWKIFGQAVQAHPRIPGEMTKHVHKSLSKIEISFVWHSCTAVFRDIFVCQGSARLSFAVSRKAVPRIAPLFWQEGISYVALDLPGFEAPTKFVLNFRLWHSSPVAGSWCLGGAKPFSHVWFQHWFLVGFFKDSYFKQCQPQDLPTQTAQLWSPHTSHFSNATTETCLWPCPMLHDA